MEGPTKRVGNKCEFSLCAATKRDNADRTFFKFPVKRKLECSEWVINCANEKIADLNDNQLQHRTVCNIHFARECFTSDMKNKLVKGAIPTLLIQNPSSQTSSSQNTELISEKNQNVQTTHKEFTNVNNLNLPECSSTGHNHIGVIKKGYSITAQTSTYSKICNSIKDKHSHNSDSVTEKQQVSVTPPSTPNFKKIQERTPTPHKLNPDKETPRKTKLRRSLNKFRTSHNKKRMQLKRLQLKSTQAKLSKESIFMAASKHIKSSFFKTLLKMQMLHKKNNTWKEDEKQASIEMFYHSPALYNNLRENKDMHLPSRVTISKWLNVTNLMPGISEDLLELTKIKIKNMSNTERQSVLVFDEMTIKRSLQYNEKRDIIEGFQDLGTLGRSKSLGTHVLTFLVRGLMHKWKMPVAYFVVANSARGNTIAELLKQCIQALSDIGLVIRAVVCDQGPNNRNAAKLLQVSHSSPFFMFETKKIFLIYDAPHIFKCLRNSLIKTNILFDGGCARWSHIQQLYNLDASSNKARALCKLTPKHISPNSFDKMKVKLATQVFSHSVKAAMFTGVQTEQLPTEALETADYIGKLNDLFDCLNSRVQFDANPMKCALSTSSAGIKIERHLENSLQWIQTWIRDTNSRREVVKPPCFFGLQQTINGIIQLWREMKEDNYKFLLTNRLTQDALENEFSIARQRCGYERNPSAMQFRQSLRYRIHVTLMKPPETTNCEVEDDEFIGPASPEVDTQSDTEGEGADIDGDLLSKVRPSIPQESSSDESDDGENSGFRIKDAEVSTQTSPPSSHPQSTLESCSVQ